MKPVSLLPRLYDIKPFINHEHPEYHPDSTSYQKYWRDEEIKCVEGMWGLDSDGVNGGWRYMPGNLYFYTNFCIIEDEDEKGNTTRIIHPMLRDVEWLLVYGWLTCRGFSGFFDDEENTCHLMVKQIEDNGIDSLTPKQKILLEGIGSVLRKPDGTFKKYVEAREYLYRTHDKPLGLALFYNRARNFFVLGSRGFGKSFFCGNAVIGHEYNFYGKKFFDQEYLKNPSPVEIFVGSALASKSSDLLKKFSSSQEWMKKHYGSWGSGDEFIPGYFYNNSTGSLRPNNADSAYRHEYKYREGGTWMTGGTGTKIQHGIYTSENPQAAVGTRPTVMVIEEVGLLKNVLEVHASNETCQIRRNKFGSSFYIGTGGNMEKITESKIIFRDPEAYNFLGYVDHWENSSNPIGFFLPAYYVDNDFKDENGNTDVDAAFDEEMRQRELRRKAATSSALDGYMMSRPLVPSEMFLSPSANVFPTAKLRERLAKVETEKIFEIWGTQGELVYTDYTKTEVKWIPDLRKKFKPINTLNLDSYQGNINGCITMFEDAPDNIPAPTYYRSLYKVVYDPVKDDGEGTSLSSIIVYKGYSKNNWNSGDQDTIVAEYIGRYDRVNDMHEIAIKLAMYYNAKVLVETNLPDFVRYCKMTGRYGLLQLSPYEAISKVIKNPGRKYDVGVTMGSKTLNIHAEQLLRQWLLEPWKTTNDGVVLYNLDKIKSLRILNEFISYDRDGNFDSISALKLLGLWLSQETEVKMPEDIEKNRETSRMEDIIKINVTRLRSRNKPFHAY